MSVNSSSNDSNLLFDMECLFVPPSSFIFTSYNIIYILLLLPLCSFILYHGLQQWRQSRSTSSAVTMSHSDSFTYHLVTMELISIFERIIICCGVYMEDLNMLILGNYIYSFVWFGQMFFHVLTCVERYLAVVHPVTYLGLRRERGTRIRNVTIGCVWLLCLAGTVLEMINSLFLNVNLFILTMSVTVVSFCSISVLRVLTRPGPGEQGGGRERVDQSKQRAFYTIVTILGVLLLKFAWDLGWTVLYLSGRRGNCFVFLYDTWVNLPSSLVLPLLFLHRAGKLVCCRNTNQTG